jgi:hypothetical protein
MAGVAKPASMDGRSLLPLLIDAENASARAMLSTATQEHLRHAGGRSAARARWRDAVLLTHYFFTENVKCVGDCTECTDCRGQDTNCGDTLRGGQCWSTRDATWKQVPSECTGECYATESRDNNFVALRHVGGAGPFADTLYAEFQTGELDEAPVDFLGREPAFTEFFDAAADPWLLENVHERMDSGARAALRAQLRAWLQCAGEACP